MTGAELVSEAISYYDNTLPNDATNAARRLRILHNAQMVKDEIYNTRDWPFKQHTRNIQIQSGEGLLPSFPNGIPTEPEGEDGISFGRLAREGAVFETSGGNFWTESTLQEIMAMRTSLNLSRRIFAIGSTTGPNGKKIIIPNTVEVGPLLTIFFDAAPAPIFDTTDEIVDIPHQYHRTVLLAGTIVRMQTSKSDVRDFWQNEYAKGLARMIANEIPLQSRVKQLPRFSGGRQW